MNFFSRRTALAAISALALAACGNGDAAGNGPLIADSGELGHAKGSADAPVVLIEYASPTCPACKYWHDTIEPAVMSDYVETGKVKFVFREFPLHTPDVPAYLVAMCAGEDNYFDVLDELFEYQSGIVDAARNGVLKPALMSIGARHGLEDEAEFDACMNNRALRERMADIVQTGEKFGVNGTPTFIVDGRKIDFENMNSLEKVTAALNDALEAKGVALPVTDVEAAEDPSDIPEGSTGEPESTGADTESENAGD